jgi:hypothetical protein
MTSLRRALAPLAAIWLLCQIATVALVPVAVWVSAADPHGAECTCGRGGADAMCPMHRHKPAGDAASHCSMQASNKTGTGVLTTIVIAGLIPESTPSLVPPVPSMNVSPTDVDVRGERPVPPDPPPPRV